MSFQGAPWAKPQLDDPSLNPRDIEDKEVIKSELFALHQESGVFGSCTLDMINKTADILVQHEPGILKCQKKYKLVV